jgi:hypothetical protein
MKLQQNQFWKIEGGCVCIVRLERLSVSYKSIKDIASIDGTHHHVSKKEFTRLIKGGTLVSPEEVRIARGMGFPSGK